MMFGAEPVSWLDRYFPAGPCVFTLNLLAANVDTIKWFVSTVRMVRQPWDGEKSDFKLTETFPWPSVKPPPHTHTHTHTFLISYMLMHLFVVLWRFFNVAMNYWTGFATLSVVTACPHSRSPRTESFYRQRATLSTLSCYIRVWIADRGWNVSDSPPGTRRFEASWISGELISRRNSWRLPLTHYFSSVLVWRWQKRNVTSRPMPA